MFHKYHGQTSRFLCYVFAQHDTCSDTFPHRYFASVYTKLGLDACFCWNRPEIKVWDRYGHSKW